MMIFETVVAVLEIVAVLVNTLVIKVVIFRRPSLLAISAFNNLIKCILLSFMTVMVDTVPG